MRVSREALEKVDTSGARWGRALASGLYRARITDGRDDTSKTSNNEMMVFTLNFEEVTKEQAPEGMVKIDYHVASAWGVKNFLEALAPEFLQTNDLELEINPADFIDAECLAKVVQEKYEGTLRPKVSNLLPLEAPATAAAAPAPAAKEAVPHGGSVPAPTSSPPVPAAAQAGVQAALDDDSLPF